MTDLPTARSTATPHRPAHLLALDPGSERSGWVIIDTDTQRPLVFGKTANADVLEMCRFGYAIRTGLPSCFFDGVVIEWTMPRGMPASEQLFEALWWAGRFTEALEPLPVHRIERKAVVRHLTHKQTATDANIRAALIDRYGGVGGKAAAIGLKASPGPLYRIADDVWAALALAVTELDWRRGLVELKEYVA